MSNKIYIYDSLSKQKKLFEPIEANKVRMYVCGATVYDYCHIGNARTWTAFDVVYRYLKARGYEVQYVRNITDIDDKIIQRAAQNDESPMALADRYTQILQEDFVKLGLLPPTAEPRATDWVKQMIAMTKAMIQNGNAYATQTGDVYYSVDQYQKYGELSHQTLSELQHGIRVEVAESKHSPLDFVLWKAAKPGEPAWESPWGLGRPGWHIECSAMATGLLGETIDIHGGGFDLTFPHHENERAQTEVVTQKTFVNYWMHAGFLNINQEKMSKSLNNFFKLRDVLSQYDAEVVRFIIAARWIIQQKH
jgi:cysteinyl-tRNA synthetase